MQPESRKLLADMREAADAIAAFTSRKSLADLANDALLRSGIYFQFVIIGEALSQLRTKDEETAERISEYWADHRFPQPDHPRLREDRR